MISCFNDEYKHCVRQKRCLMHNTVYKTNESNYGYKRQELSLLLRSYNFSWLTDATEIFYSLCCFPVACCVYVGNSACRWGVWCWHSIHCVEWEMHCGTPQARFVSSLRCLVQSNCCEKPTHLEGNTADKFNFWRPDLRILAGRLNKLQFLIPHC